MTAERYTLAEAKVELNRQQCAEGGHSPYLRVATFIDPIGRFTCECGELTWSPNPPSRM